MKKQWVKRRKAEMKDREKENEKKKKGRNGGWKLIREEGKITGWEKRKSN